ncbi:MAG TPA: hypothetical protein VFK56_13385 [Mycobacterium sp.]|nr:hypothetical protein [Mycobacterium sp.]
MTEIANLVQRSAELKRELLDFSQQPRFDREFREVLVDHFSSGFITDESELIAALDYFVLQHELRSGKTVVERFVANRPDLGQDDRELLLGWRDVVEGIFEVQGRDGDALVAENLVDELTYRVHSNMGPRVFRPLKHGSFMIGRLVPVGPEWLISGNLNCFPKSERVAIHRIACEITLQFPQRAFRNPDKLARAQQLQRAHHDQFVKFFGADFVVISGAQLTERMRHFYTFCREQTMAELATSGKQSKNLPFRAPDYPADLVASDAVAVTHDEIEGLGMYAQFGMIEEAFADPSLLRHPNYRRGVRDYLDDPTVSPLLFVRMAARDLERTNQVFRKLLGRKHFDWTVDGDKLMRRCKPDYFDQPRLPHIVPLSEKLARHAASA